MKGYTQEDVGHALGVSQQTVAKWECGTAAPAKLATMRRLGTLLDTHPKTLFPDIFGGVYSPQGGDKHGA